MRVRHHLTALLALAGIAFGGDYSSWGNYRTVTVNTTGVTTNAVTNIPVLVRFNPSDHANMFTGPAAVLANGADIRVTKADGTTDIPFEVDHWVTGASGSGALWVLLDNVAANSANAATFRVYWRKEGAVTMSNPSATFSPANGYQAVFHLSEPTTDTVRDAANGYKATNVNTYSTLDFFEMGQVGPAREFYTSQPGANDPADNYLHFSPGASAALSTHTGAMTLEAWVVASPVSINGNTSAGIKQIIAHNNANGDGAYLLRSGTGAPGNYYSAGGTAAQVETNIGPRTPFQEQTYWVYLNATYNGTAWVIRRQRDITMDEQVEPWGSPIISGGETTPVETIAGAGPVATANPWFIGAYSSDGTTSGTMSRPWAGRIDEVRISTVARSDDFTRLSFESQRRTPTVVTVGANVTVSVKPGSETSPSRLWTRREGASVVFLMPEGIASGRVSVVDMQGREVWGRAVSQGEREVSWNGLSSAGKALRGVYVARLTVGGAKGAVAESRVVLSH